MVCCRSCSTWMSTPLRFYYGVLQVMFYLDEYSTKVLLWLLQVMFYLDEYSSKVLLWCVTGHVPPG